MNDKQILQLLALLKAGTASNKEITPDVMELYAMYLRAIPADVMSRAVTKMLTHITYFPTIADITSAAANELLLVSSAVEAWASIEQQIAKVGSRGEPEYENDLIREVVKAKGGWSRLCQFYDPYHTRRWFLETYNALLERRREDITKPWREIALASMEVKWLAEPPSVKSISN